MSVIQQFEDDLEWLESKLPRKPKAMTNAEMGKLILRGIEYGKLGGKVLETEDPNTLRPKRQTWRKFPDKHKQRLQQREADIVASGHKVSQKYKEMYWYGLAERYESVRIESVGGKINKIKARPNEKIRQAKDEESARMKARIDYILANDIQINGTGDSGKVWLINSLERNAGKAIHDIDDQYIKAFVDDRVRRSADTKTQDLLVRANADREEHDAVDRGDLDFNEIEAKVEAYAEEITKECNNYIDSIRKDERNRVIVGEHADLAKKLYAKVNRRSLVDDLTTIEEVEEALVLAGYSFQYAKLVLDFGLHRWKVAQDKKLTIHDKDYHGKSTRDRRSLQRMEDEWLMINLLEPEATECLWADPARIYLGTLTTDRYMDRSNYQKLVTQVLDHLNRHIYRRKEIYKVEGICGIVRIEWKSGVPHLHLKLIIPASAGELSDAVINKWNRIIWTKWEKVVAKQRTSLGQPIRALKIAQDGRMLGGSTADVYAVVGYLCKTEAEEDDNHKKRALKQRQANRAITADHIKYTDPKPEYDMHTLMAMVDKLDPANPPAEKALQALSDWLPQALMVDQKTVNNYFRQIARTDLVNNQKAAPTRPPHSKLWFVYNKPVLRKYQAVRTTVVRHDLARHIKAEACKETNRENRAKGYETIVAPKPFQIDMTFRCLSAMQWEEVINRAEVSMMKAQEHIQAQCKRVAIIRDICSADSNPLPKASGWP